MGSWLLNSDREKGAVARLFLFPSAGGGTQMYRAWPEAFPREIDVRPILLPGRERRLNEEPYTQLRPLVEAIVEAITPLLDVPSLFFGHSMGAALAFETAALLRSRGHHPKLLLVSGCPAPSIPLPYPAIHALPNDELIASLRRFRTMAPEVLENSELLELIIPMLRADFELGETYQYLPVEPFVCPLIVFGGADDPLVPISMLEGWSEHAAGRFQLELLPGDHMFLDDERPRLLRAIREEISRALAR